MLFFYASMYPATCRNLLGTRAPPVLLEFSWPEVAIVCKGGHAHIPRTGKARRCTICSSERKGGRLNLCVQRALTKVWWRFSVAQGYECLCMARGCAPDACAQGEGCGNDDVKSPRPEATPVTRR